MRERRGIDLVPSLCIGRRGEQRSGHYDSEKSKHTPKHERSPSTRVVITGLVPVIHVLLSLQEAKTWMAGSSPAMTAY
jgi:hypothetical protein